MATTFTGVNAMLGTDSGRERIGVRLFLWNESEHMSPLLGRYRYRNQAWFAAQLMVARLRDAMQRQGGISTTDAALVALRADRAAWTTWLSHQPDMQAPEALPVRRSRR